MGHRLGLIGAGGIAAVHAEAANAIGQTIAVVCDLNERRAGALAEKYGAAVVTDVADLLAIENLDGVVIATPNVTHRDLTVRVLQNNCHVLLEKPMAMTVDECDEILNAESKSQARVFMNFVCRQSPTAIAASKLIEDGALGNIYHAKASLYRQRGIPGLGRWFTTKAQSGGGVLIDLGVHVIDLLLHLCNDAQPTGVSGYCGSHFGSPISAYRYSEMWGGHPNPDGVFDVDDQATGFIRCGKDLSFEINVTWAANIAAGKMRDGVIVLGDKGGLFLDLWTDELVLTTEQDGVVADLTQTVETDNAWDDAWQNQHRSFASAIDGAGKGVCTSGQGRRVQSILQAWYESADRAQEIAIS